MASEACSNLARCAPIATAAAEEGWAYSETQRPRRSLTATFTRNSNVPYVIAAVMLIVRMSCCDEAAALSQKLGSARSNRKRVSSCNCRCSSCHVA